MEVIYIKGTAFSFSTFTFTFMHLADAFIQSDLHCIQVTVFTFLSALAFPGNRTHDLGVASAMLYQLSYRKAIISIRMTILKYIKSTQHLDPNGPPDINVVQYKSYEIFQVQTQESLSLVSSSRPLDVHFCRAHTR